MTVMESLCLKIDASAEERSQCVRKVKVRDISSAFLRSSSAFLRSSSAFLRSSSAFLRRKMVEGNRAQGSRMPEIGSEGRLRLGRDFFARDGITVARGLLGKILVHETKTSGRLLSEQYLPSGMDQKHIRPDTASIPEFILQLPYFF